MLRRSRCHWRPLPLPSAGVGPVDFEAFRLVEGGLHPQPLAVFVIGLDGIAPGAVLEAHAFGPMLQVTDDLVLEAAIDLARRRGHAMAPEAHHLQALEVAQGMVKERRIVLLERLGALKDQIGGVLALGDAPRVMQASKGGHDLAVERMGLLQQVHQQARPVSAQLSVGQRLGACRILEPHKAVVGAPVT
jgi:hypothetical protein